MPKLVLKKKAEIILEYELSKDLITVGSMEGCDIYIPDKTVSLHHCELKKENGKFVIYDLKGAYGTLVNGEKITSKDLNFEDKVDIGEHSLIYRPLSNEVKGDGEYYYLLGIHGPFEGKKFELNPGETRVGRGEEQNDIVLPKEIDHSVSRRHTTIIRTGDKFLLSDKRSRNRTFVNQYQVKEEDEVPLYLKDEILIGHSVFRFVNEAIQDYSTPKKAGIFWVRFKTKLLYLLFGVVLFSAVIAFYYGFYGILIISNTPKTFSLQNSAWSPKTGKEKIDYSFYPDYDIIPSPAIGDTNNDGKSEIVTYNNTGVYAWNSQKGNLLWKMLLNQKDSNITSSPVLADVNGDKCLDVIICSGDSRVYIINGLTGKLIYKSEILGGNLNSSPVVEDLDNDGLQDLVLASEEGILYFIYDPITSGKISSARLGTEVFSSPTVYPDRKKKLVAIGSSVGKIFFFNGGQSSDFSFIDTKDTINKLLGVHLPINEISTTPAIADLDGDENLDVVVHSNQYYVAAVNISSRELNWVHQIEPPSEKPSPLHYSSPVLADLDADGKPDIIVASCNGKIRAIKGTNGESLWEFETGKQNRIIASPALADFNKDGIADVALGNEDGYIYILNGDAHLQSDVDRVLFKEKISPYPITASLAIGDLDGDGFLDIVYIDRNNQTGIYNTNTRVFNAQLIWPMFQRDALHSGANLTKKTYQPYLSFLIGGVFACLLTIALSITIRKNKIKKRPLMLPLK